jgi:uncharacterized protein (DUF2252 family)
MVSKNSAAHASLANEILASNADRKLSLFRIKCRRMRQDPFAFFRGTDHRFATLWQHLAPPDVGPAVLICGDLHLENFGAYRTDDGDLLYDINDFDESLVAPCSLDLVRCTTSILLAAQNWSFTPVQAMRTLLAFLDRYRTTVVKAVRSGHVGEIALGTARGPIWSLLRRPARGDRTAFLDRFTTTGADGRRRIERASGRFRTIDRASRDDVAAAVVHYGRQAAEPRAFEVLDVAFRVAGIGSLGLERYAVLVRGGGTAGKEWLLDLKKVGPPALLPCAQGEAQPDDGGSNARRAVNAQRRLQSRPTAKLDVMDVDGRSLRLRELIPEENRTGLDRLRKRPRRLRRAVAVAGRLTAWAHVRGSRLDHADRSSDLARWTAGPGLDAVIASAIRYAERTRKDHKAFCHALDNGLIPAARG